ncbi:MAG: DUF3124 domain-containing protein [Myxococcota bacterium]
MRSSIPWLLLSVAACTGTESEPPPQPLQALAPVSGPASTDASAPERPGAGLPEPSASPVWMARELSAPQPVYGQRLYVPVYSHTFYGDGRPLLLAITLSVRNTSATQSITLEELHYLDSQGKAVKEFDRGKQLIAPLATAEFFIPERDTSGGASASFVLSWRAEKPTPPPLVQAIMLSTRSQLGVSFLTEGYVLETHHTDRNHP